MRPAAMPASPVTQPHPVVPLGCQEPIHGLAHAWVTGVAELNEEAHGTGVSAGGILGFPNDPLARNPATTTERAVLALVCKHELTAPLDAFVLRSQPQVGQGTQHPEGARVLGQVVIPLDPVALSLLGRQQFHRRRAGGDRGLGCLHFRVVGRPVENVGQRPVTDGRVLPLQQPGNWISLERALPFVHSFIRPFAHSPIRCVVPPGPGARRVP